MNGQSEQKNNNGGIMAKFQTLIQNLATRKKDQNYVELPQDPPHPTEVRDSVTGKVLFKIYSDPYNPPGDVYRNILYSLIEKGDARFLMEHYGNKRIDFKNISNNIRERDFINVARNNNKLMFCLLLQYMMPPWSILNEMITDEKIADEYIAILVNAYKDRSIRCNACDQFIFSCEHGSLWARKMNGPVCHTDQWHAAIAALQYYFMDDEFKKTHPQLFKSRFDLLGHLHYYPKKDPSLVIQFTPPSASFTLTDENNSMV